MLYCVFIGSPPRGLILIAGEKFRDLSGFRKPPNGHVNGQIVPCAGQDTYFSINYLGVEVGGVLHAAPKWEPG